MKVHAKHILWSVAVAGVVSLMLIRLLSVSQRYPYYFIWDMDHVVGLDSLLINSDRLPDGIGHPGFGMYLFQSVSQKTARRLNVISVSNLKDIEESLNPLGAMAEFTDYIRRHTPFVLTAIVLMLWTAICISFPLRRWCGLLFLLVLGSQESLTYHASMVRSEVYSVFFWSCAVLVAGTVAKTARTPVRGLGLLSVGLLLGLALLTKVQALFYLAAAVVIVLLFRSLANDRTDSTPSPISRRLAKGLAAVSVFNAVVFASVMVMAYGTTIPAGVATFAKSYGMTPLSLLIAPGLLALLLIHVVAAARGSTPTVGFRFAAFLTVLACGFFLSLAFHFVIVLKPATSWTYLLYDFKMLFVRTGLYEIDPSMVAGPPLDFFRHNPLLYTIHVALLATLAAGRYYKFILVSRQQLLYCVAATLLALVTLSLGTRFILRDGLWAETLFNFLSLVYLAILVTRSVRHRPSINFVGGGVIASLVVVNCFLSNTMLKRIDANFNLYGWREDRWSSAVYTANQQLYSRIIGRKYDSASLSAALRATTDHTRIRHTAEFVFQNVSPTHRNIGIAVEGLPVWTQYPSYKIAALSEALRGAIVVDASSLPIHSGPLFRSELVRADAENFDKFRSDTSTDLLSVLTRHDLRIFMFVRGNDFLKFQNTFVQPTGFIITLRNMNETLEMRGLEIKNYSEVRVREFAYNYFFVIGRK